MKPKNSLRSRIDRVTYLGLATVVGLAIHLRMASAADWPGYRGPNHDGTTSERVEKWPGAGPKEIWKIPTPNGFSSFAVGGGKAFTQVTREIDGVGREVCIGLDAATGKELWAVPLGIAKYGHDGGNTGAPNNSGGDGPRSTPALDGDRVYVMSADLVLYCLAADSGQARWKKDLIREHSGANINWKNAASPIIDGGLVFVAGGGPSQALLGINKFDGTVAWKTESDKMTHATPVVADIFGERQVIFLTQSGLIALGPTDGRVLWRYPFKYNVSTGASPVVAIDAVYCSAGYGMGAAAVRISRNDGKWTAAELWRKPNQLMNHWSTPVQKDGYLYGMFGFKEYGTAPLKCIELATGREIWSRSGFGPGNVTLVGDRLLVLGDAGQLILAEASPKGYTELARTRPITGKCWSTPAVSGGRIYVRSTTEGACLDASSKLMGGVTH